MIRNAPNPMGRGQGILALLVATSFALSCAGEATKVNAPALRKGAMSDPASDPTLNGPQNPNKPNTDDAIKDRRLIDLTMELRAEAIGIKACSGDLRIQFVLPDKDDKDSKFLNVPTDTVECILIGKLGLKEILDVPDDGRDNILVSEDGVIGYKRLIGPVDYEPYRPFLPAFMSATPQQLQAVNMIKPVKLISALDGRSTTGSVKIKMQNYRSTFHHDKLARDFNEVYDFEIFNEGFDGVNRLPLFLFDRMLIRIALKPFAILRLELDTHISDALNATSDGGPSLGGPLIGILTKLIKVKVVGETKDVHGALQDLDGDDDPGEVINGVPTNNGG